MFAVYRATLLPGLGAWDTGEAQTVLPILGTMHPTGFPAYAIIGWLASIVLSPLGSPAFTINLLSAILVATAAGLTVAGAEPPGAAGRRYGRRASGFGLSPIVWRVATGRTPTPSTRCSWSRSSGSCSLGAARPRPAEHPDDPRLPRRADRAIVLAAAVFGVSVANHGLTLLLIPAVGAVRARGRARIVCRPKVVAARSAACFGVAALLYLELPFRAGHSARPLVYGHPETSSGFWEVVLAPSSRAPDPRGARRRGQGRGLVHSRWRSSAPW